jgi:hypothetical protein
MTYWIYDISHAFEMVLFQYLIQVKRYVWFFIWLQGAVPDILVFVCGSLYAVRIVASELPRKDLPLATCRPPARHRHLISERTMVAHRALTSPPKRTRSYVSRLHVIHSEHCAKVDT